MSKQSRAESGSKWACEYCTYENFPASKKCTLCRATRPPQIIDQTDYEQDIYKMAPLVSSCQNKELTVGLPPAQQVVSNQALDPRNKWPCQICTYLNWPKSIRCTQCLTPRPKAVAVVTPSTTQSLQVSVSITESNSGRSPSGSLASHNTSPRTSPSSPEAAKSINNEINRSVISIAQTLAKWSCRACTYENWPRTTKCVLCNSPRGGIPVSSSAVVSSQSVSPGRPSSPTLTSLPGSPSTPTKPSITSISQSESITEDSGSRPSSSSSRRKKKSPPGSSGHSPACRSLENIEAIGATASETLPGGRHGPSTTPQVRLVTSSGLRDLDWLWLNACQGVVEGDAAAVEAFLAGGGDPARQLRADECSLLGRTAIFERGHTLVHLAIRFQREDMLAVLLTASDVVSKARKRVPAQVAPDLANQITREIAASTRQRKGDFPCFFLTEIATFALPADIEDFPKAIKKQLFDEILDRGVQSELQDEEPVLNWSAELTRRLGSTLYTLWNRTAGDCLLDSVLQATWGVMDRDNTLRRVLADSLLEGANLFYPRWKDAETLQAQSLHFSLDESQWQQDWSIILSIASQPGSSLEQIHIFALAHILRRPIIVYGIRYIKNFRGENIGLAKFQGVYLPLLWEQSFCWKTPIALGYTRGHFSAVVAMERNMCEVIGAGAHTDNQEPAQVAYLPLMDSEGKLLPVHFLSPVEMGHEEALLRDWLDVCVTSGGLLVAQQRLPHPPLLVRQMLDEWLERYRRLAHCLATPNPAPDSSPSRHAKATDNLSSDDETDDE